MLLLHVNEYYINFDYIAFIKESDTEYTIHFGIPGESKSCETVVQKAKGTDLIQRLGNMGVTIK